MSELRAADTFQSVVGAANSRKWLQEARRFFEREPWTSDKSHGGRDQPYNALCDLQSFSATCKEHNMEKPRPENGACARSTIWPEFFKGGDRDAAAAWQSWP